MAESPPQDATATQGATKPRFGEVKIRERGRLPHWEEESGLYFVAFRLNHVHVVFRVLPGGELASILRSWKSYTARMANRILCRSGNFWQREYYDRLIRDGDELERALQYVASNPERAGLKGWDWVWSAGVDAPTTAGLETSATS